MPSPRSCIPGYGVADILTDVILPIPSVGTKSTGVDYADILTDVILPIPSAGYGEYWGGLCCILADAILAIPSVGIENSNNVKCKSGMQRCTLACPIIGLF